MNDILDFSDIDSLADQLEEAPRDGEQIQSTKVEFLQRGKYQPRRSIPQEGLESLAESILEQGVIQPIIIRPINETRFEIIAGERRWRAAKIANLEKVPCIVREMNDTQARAVALIENIDREDMELLDEILAIAGLATDIGATQAAKILGKSDKKKKKGFVSKCLKINQAPDFVHDFIQSGYSSDVDALYTLAMLAKEKAEEAKTLVHRWDEDPKIRTGLRKQVDIARKGVQEVLEVETPKAINDAEKEEMMAELDADFAIDESVSHAKQSGGKSKKTKSESNKGVSHAKQSEDDEPLIVLNSAVFYKEGKLVMHTNEGDLTFEVGEDAKEILRKTINN